MNKKFQNIKGFTLLETLIAIAIMTVAVGSAFTMAQKSLMTSYQSKNQIAAYFLAAEGLELVRNIRDSVAFYNNKNPTSSQIGWIKPLESACVPSHLTSKCDINPLADFSNPNAISSSIASCAAPEGCRLHQVSNSGKTIYTSFDSGQPSVFFRSIYIVCSPTMDCIPDSSGKSEAIVTSTVTWNGQTVYLTETINNWHQI